MDIRRHPAAWLAASLLALGATAHAAPQPKNVDPLRLQYEREKADCLTGKTSEPRNVCLREAAAAYAQARQGRLGSSADQSAQWAANALKRCEVQRGEDRTLCERRVREGQVVGSVDSGGELSTLTVRETDIPKAPGG
ncbi:hypothetical protein [Pelomonas cellulosilytica]|uniref:Lysozyme inhibitor LprI N-terminal domain-containing protein n=1 Tax=Pelomonas cellulosilytica TaxID=2906762 RepID=A0ABS8XRN0_9BURK|nr:hypothetical protein [Pelomonas sp. P8]MCE4553408.1 hypothetical protein [Pelomonas sp. P8]